LALPAAPFPALRRTALTMENRNRLLALTAPASLGGFPVLTVPIPLPSALTAGLQIVVAQSRSPVLDWVLSRI
jgi:aspartyl-tRNA(Asn)/glutamyl-tRNA(Gln) amidotransferase subunit A